MAKPICYFLVGVPGSGKSTWMAPILKKFPNTVLVSSDQYIEQAAAKAGKTYGEVFQNEIKSATAKMNASIDAAVKQQKDIIWDQTNLTPESRRKKISRLTGYDIVAVCFEISAPELARRQIKRKAESGKEVPAHIIQSMLNQYVRPTTSEGFSKVIVVN